MEINKDFLSFLDLCSQKDRDAWDHFINKYSRLIHNYIIKTLQRYNYAFQEDVLEEIFNRVFLALLDNDCKRLKNFRGRDERSFTAYLREIIFHLTIDFLREQKRFIALECIEYVNLDKDKDKELDDYNLLKTIMTLKNELSEKHKYLFKLIYEEDLGMSEIAKIMNLKLNAVHQMKFRMINRIIDIAREKDLYKDLYYKLEKSSVPN